MKSKLLQSFLLTPVLVIGLMSLSSQAHAAKWALLIGVDDYHHARNLKFCCDDQTALKKQLVAGGIDADQIFLMSSEASDSKMLPFKANIEKQLELVFNLIEKGDVLIVAFSGHGVQLNSQSYICPTDSELRERNSLISIRSIYERMERCRASMKLLVIDACRNQPARSGKRPLDADLTLNDFTRAIVKSPIPKGVVMLNSCSPGETSWEDQKLGHGVFMHFLLQGLEGDADQDRDQQVTVAEITNYARRKTGIYVARRFNGSQVPWYRASGSLDSLHYALTHVKREVNHQNKPGPPKIVGKSKPNPGSNQVQSLRFRNLQFRAGQYVRSGKINSAVELFLRIVADSSFSEKEIRTANVQLMNLYLQRKQSDDLEMAIDCGQQARLGGAIASISSSAAYLKTANNPRIKSVSKGSALKLTETQGTFCWVNGVGEDERSKGWIDEQLVTVCDRVQYPENLFFNAPIRELVTQLSEWQERERPPIATSTNNGKPTSKPEESNRPAEMSRNFQEYQQPVKRGCKWCRWH